MSISLLCLETCLNHFDNRSKEWVCPHCQQPNLELLPDPSPESEASTSAKNLESPEVSNNVPERAQPLNVAIDQPPALESSPTASPRGVNDTKERTVVPTLRTSVVLEPSRRSSHKPPLLLDTAICVLLVLVFGIICRRMV